MPACFSVDYILRDNNAASNKVIVLSFMVLVPAACFTQQLPVIARISNAPAIFSLSLSMPKYNPFQLA